MLPMPACRGWNGDKAVPSCPWGRAMCPHHPSVRAWIVFGAQVWGGLAGWDGLIHMHSLGLSMHGGHREQRLHSPSQGCAHG